VALNSRLPLTGEPSVSPISLRGQSTVDQRTNPTVNSQVVSRDYFATMRIAITAGRGFDDRDTPTSERVAVVSQWLSQRLWPGRDPVGEQVKFGAPDSRFPWLTIVAVVSDVRESPFGSHGADIYRPLAQSAPENVYYALRTNVPPHTLASAATQAVWRVDPTQATFDMRSMTERVADHVWAQRVSAMVFGGFAALALLTAAVGVFGVVSYAVAQRTREFGIRVAIGARPGEIVSSVLRQSVGFAILGTGLGAAVFLVAAPYASTVLHEVSPFDLSVAAAGVVLATVCLMAGYVPARRASRVDPVAALRGD
jgi:putative ABC transport system permease protein